MMASMSLARSIRRPSSFQAIDPRVHEQARVVDVGRDQETLKRLLELGMFFGVGHGRFDALEKRDERGNDVLEAQWRRRRRRRRCARDGVGHDRGRRLGVRGQTTVSGSLSMASGHGSFFHPRGMPHAWQSAAAATVVAIVMAATTRSRRQRPNGFASSTNVRIAVDSTSLAVCLASSASTCELAARASAARTRTPRRLKPSTTALSSSWTSRPTPRMSRPLRSTLVSTRSRRSQVRASHEWSSHPLGLVSRAVWDFRHVGHRTFSTTHWACGARTMHR